MEGRVHAQNDEFGHSRVDTHTHIHIHIQKSTTTNVSVSWSLDRRSLSEPTVPAQLWFFSQHSDKMVLETMWLPVVVKENVTSVNTTQNCSGDFSDTLDLYILVFTLLLHSHFSSTRGIFNSSHVVSFWLPRSHLVTGCLLAVIICHSTPAWLWQYTYVSFHLPKQDQYAACYKGDGVIGGHGVWSGLHWGLVIDFRFSGIPAARMAKNTDSRSDEYVEKCRNFAGSVFNIFCS